MKINIQIDKLLSKKGKTKYWLSKEIGISHQNLTKLARNETTSIRFCLLEDLCKALDCSPNEILGWEDE